MHRVTTTIREILPADLPTVGGEPATPEQLLNMGIALYDADLNLYSVREQENDFESPGMMKPTVEIPGRVVASGPVQRRHDRLPAALKVDLWRAMIRKTVGRGASKHVELVEVDAAQIRPTDHVVQAGIKKHRWEGESER